MTITSTVLQTLTIKQLLDNGFVISRILKVEVGVNPYRDLDYSGYRKNRI